MELLLDRLSNLAHADVSRAEVLRQLNQFKPDLSKGDVLRKAKLLVNTSEDENKRRGAYDYLEGILPLTNSYKTSAGPLGTTYDDITVWDNPRKPLPFVGLIVLAIFVLIGGFVYWLGYNTVSPFIFMIGVVCAYIAAMEGAVVNNRYRARKELDDKIVQSAISFELMLDKVHD